MNENRLIFVRALVCSVFYMFTMSTIYRLPILNFNLNLRTSIRENDFQDIEHNKYVCACVQLH